MRYLHAVHMETERMFPRTIGVFRRLPEDVVFSGYRVPKGLFRAQYLNSILLNVLVVKTDQW